MQLELSGQLTQKLSPQLMTNIKLLGMTAEELALFIEQSLLENPVLEAEGETPRKDSPEPTRWTETLTLGYPRKVWDGGDNTDDTNRYGAVYDDDESLYAYLCSQLDAMARPAPLIAAAKLLAGELNSNGYFDEDPQETACGLGLPDELTAAALTLLRSLEPAGVGCSDLSECLLLQLERREGDTELAKRIVSHHLDALGRSHYNNIAASLEVPLQAVYDASAQIRALSPRPGAAFPDRQEPLYVYPDILVEKTGNSFDVSVSEGFMPFVGISDYYTRLSSATEDPEVQEYLSEKLRQAKRVIGAIENRHSMLLTLARYIVEYQEDFFSERSEHLRPLTQAAMAELMAVHPSTMSRMVRGKYLQCSKGLFPLGFFFTRAVSSVDGDPVSQRTVQAAIHELIGGENPSNPYSDQKLAQQLEDRGMAVARRTVAKYREELGFPNAAGRRALYARKTAHAPVP